VRALLLLLHQVAKVERWLLRHAAPDDIHALSMLRQAKMLRVEHRPRHGVPEPRQLRDEAIESRRVEDPFDVLEQERARLGLADEFAQPIEQLAAPVSEATSETEGRMALARESGAHQVQWLRRGNKRVDVVVRPDSIVFFIHGACIGVYLAGHATHTASPRAAYVEPADARKQAPCSHVLPQRALNRGDLTK
jgi:hypothetical protein